MTGAAAIVLAAGRSTRYHAAGGTAPTKLVDLVAGEPMLRHVVRAVLASSARPVIVVTGHARDAVVACIGTADVVVVHNPDYATGLASSLRAGLAATRDAGAAVILLGDMPLVDAAAIDALIACAAAYPAAQAVVPVHEGVRGNPVLLARSLFDRASRLEGDEGARRLLRDPAVTVFDLQMADAMVRRDVDDPAGFAGLG